MAETLSIGRALKSPSKSSATQLRPSDKVTQAAADEAPPAGADPLPRGNGNEPKQEAEAALGSFDSTAQRIVDVEAWHAEVEAALAKDEEAAQVVQPAILNARALAEVVKRFSRDWKIMAGACALASVAILGAVALPRAMIALPNPRPGGTSQAYAIP